MYTTTEYSPQFEIHESHETGDGGPNDQAGMRLVLFVVADVMLFCMLSALGKLCHTHAATFCQRKEKKTPKRKLVGVEKAVSIELT